MGLLRDGEDAETGAAMDVVVGLACTERVTGLSLDVRVRTLVVHQAEGFTGRGGVAVVHRGVDISLGTAATSLSGCDRGWRSASIWIWRISSCRGWRSVPLMLLPLVDGQKLRMADR